MAFLNERLDLGYDYGQVFGPAFNTVVISYGPGLETRHAHWSEDLGRGNLGNRRLKRSELLYLQDFFRRTKGRFSGFRFKDWGDYETTGSLIGIGDGVTLAYQMQITGTGYAKEILLPVAGTTSVKIGNAAAYQTVGFSVNTLTGMLTFDANTNANVTGITKATSAVVTVDNATNISIGESIFIAYVVGMTQINNKRGKVLNKAGNNLTIDIDSTGFSTYTSGGVVATMPILNENILASFEFDKAVRFDTDYFPRSFEAFDAVTGERFFDLQSLPIVELRAT